jgi:hypothetical protein
VAEPEHENAPPKSSEREPGFDLSLFWRNSTLWPVTVCVVGGFAALGAGAVSMALTQRNPFAKLALGVAAAMTVFALLDMRSRKGELGGGALLVVVLWALSIAGGVVLSRLGD